MGMSDDEMRKLGITDPKVLAMIRAHSLPPSGNQQQPPGERFNQAAEYVYFALELVAKNLLVSLQLVSVVALKVQVC
jgi:hypothetical protein